MALLSLVFLLVAIFLGFFRKMNTGLVCIAFALVLGRLAGVPDKEIIRGFNSSLFIMLLGVTYLFSLAQINGCLDLLAKKVVSLAGKRVYLVPIIIYVFSTVLFVLTPTMINRWAYQFAINHQINPAQIGQMFSVGYMAYFGMGCSILVFVIAIIRSIKRDKF